MKPLVYIIILNWNNPRDTIECLESVKRLKYDNFRILIVDNGSTDNSVAIFKEKFPNTEILKNEHNFGFAKGNNAGIEYALSKKADYVLILNNDTVVDEDMLEKLTAVVGEKRGIFSPKVYYSDRPKVINSLGTSLNWFRLRPNLGHCGQEDFGQFTGIGKAKILVGCALLISKETLREIGYFDEKFYMIHEDADLCLRNLKAGNENLVVPEAVIYHKASSTLGKYSAPSAYYSIRNFLYLANKHASFLNRHKTIFGLSFLMFKNGFHLLFKEDKRNEALAFFRGVKDYFYGEMGKSEKVSITG